MAYFSLRSGNLATIRDQSSSELRPAGQVGKQRAIERQRCIERFIVNSVSCRALFQRLHMSLNDAQVIVPKHLGEDVHLLFGLAVLQHQGINEIELYFLPVHQVKDYDLVSPESQVFQSVDQAVGLIIEVRYDNYNAAPVQKLSGAMKLLG